ncbi:CRISPR-associated protein Cas4 [Halococcus dombrowskii]|uniref:CRISPR-associated protein Cas4 n=1 Tax=Halococcus dombrowskii TaxID=179637 RepID=A0AAV3SID6_HALDO|nr:Dna2/Cas4 domain-containing protein [Halococcus dombrowskii]UOO95252.1 CRISPR-associated protein Cas4 [Halococcus dombrowskii]
MGKHAFSDLRSAAYCPRQCYYRRQDDDRGPPPEVEQRRELAFRYDELLDGADLADAPIAVTPTQLRTNLSCAKARFDAFDELSDPTGRDVLLTGKDCRGIAHKILELDTPVPSLVSAGSPPENGVWQPQTVHAVAAAKALAYERETPVERAFVEYPTYGVIREVALTTRRKAAYRTAIRTLESIDGPPPRLDDRSKCESCEYREECGVKTRSLRSLLGLG